MKRVKVVIERRATVHDTHFMDIPTDGENDPGQYIVDLYWDEGLPDPFSSEIIEFDEDIDVVEIIEVVESS